MKKKDTKLYGFVIGKGRFGYEIEKLDITLGEFLTLFDGLSLFDSDGDKLESPNLDNTFMFWKEKQRDHNLRRWERTIERKIEEEIKSFTGAWIGANW
tara:strand:+ start:101 stop:394 length:294 start_codon:yes stop_codon:yes gene_type:complete